MKYISLTLSLFSFLLFADLYAFDSASTKNKSAAKVAILKFSNTSKLSQYNYLADSLSSAIQEKFDQIFDYKKVSKSKITKTLSKILKKKGRKWHQLSLDNIKTLAEKEKIDVIIYGNYVAQRREGKKTDKLTIITKIYFASRQQNIILSKKVTEVTSLLLVVSDKIAKSAITKISHIVGLENKKTVEKKDTRPIILADIQAKQVSSKLQKKRRSELIRIKKSFEKAYDVDVFFLSEYLKDNVEIKAPVKLQGKKSLVLWSKKNNISRLVSIQFKSNFVKISVAVNDQSNKKNKLDKKIKYHIDSSDKVKRKKIKKAVSFLKPAVKKKIKRGRQKRKRSFNLAYLNSLKWQDVVYEVGFNLFYQLGVGQESGSLFPLIGGFRLYSRTSFDRFENLFTKRDLLPSWLSNSIHLGVQLGVSTFSDLVNNRSFHNFSFSFEAGYLYYFSNRLRGGGYLAPAYNIFSVSNNPDIVFTSFILSFYGELSYIWTNNISFSLGGGDSMSFGNGIGHELFVSLGVSYLKNK